MSRNPALAHALPTLGLAEREGLGIATRYAHMLRAGHLAPEITQDGGAVVVTDYGGKTDLGLSSTLTSFPGPTPGWTACGPRWLKPLC